MKKSLIAGLSLASLTLVPTLAFAAVPAAAPAIAGAATITDIPTLILAIRGWLNLIIGLFFALAVFYIIWGVFEFVQSAGDEAKRAEGRSRMITGIIGAAVMLSIYGLIGIVTASVTLTPTASTVPLV